VVRVGLGCRRYRFRNLQVTCPNCRRGALVKANGNGSSRVAALNLRSLRATQSSEGWGGRPHRAIDGNTSQRYASRSCTHTNRHGHPWWRLDLRATYKLSRITVWNRQDCCAGRLNGARVTLDGRTCGNLRSSSSTTLSCPRSGRVLQVRLPRSDYLTICEIKLWGTKAAEAAAPRVTYTTAVGGHGGRALSSYCAPHKYINYWYLRTGSLVDRLQGRCSDGRWLRHCGGNGGGAWRGSLNTNKILVRYGSLIDKFWHRGGNGGRATWLTCPSGAKITGYNVRCGALVDRLQFQCKGNSSPARRSQMKSLISIGSQRGSCTKCANAPSSGYKCASEINRGNWYGGQRYGDRFRTRVSGRRICVTRFDPPGRNCHGWGMNLRFHCTK
jgi:hypothetical protein